MKVGRYLKMLVGAMLVVEDDDLIGQPADSEHQHDVTHLVTHLVWPHGGPISMRPRALRTMQNPLKTHPCFSNFIKPALE